MNLSTTTIRRIASGIAAAATLGTLASIGPFSVSMIQSNDGKIAGAAALAALGATFLRRYTTLAVTVLALVVLAIDVEVSYRVLTTGDTFFGRPMIGWGVVLQAVAAVALIAASPVQRFVARKMQTA
jgi:hypothetical protein